MVFPLHFPCPSNGTALLGLVLPLGQSLISVCMGHCKVDTPYSPNTQACFNGEIHSGPSLTRAVSHFPSRDRFPGPANLHNRN